MRHASSVCFQNRTPGIAINSQPAAARTPATTNETPRKVTAASSPFPRPRIGDPDAPATYSATSNAAATTAPEPVPVFLLPVALKKSASSPVAVLSKPVVLLSSASAPVPVLLLPVVLAN